MQKGLIHSSAYAFLISITGIVYIIGLFVPLMDSDAAHHANIALHMYLNNDFVNLISRGEDYLDKPHLLFWLSALSYHVFGVTTFAYKLPSFLFSIGAVWATYKTGSILYNKEVGKLAALILASAQAFILSCMDVRMDALLTANIILATWQLVEAATGRRWYNLVLAALFMALGFSTKGLVGIIMPATAIFFYLVYCRDFKQIFHIKWLITAACMFLCMLPVIYCYYLQYDLHPEKVIRGMTNISGVKFILWNQNVERLEGTHWGGGRRDYFFYVHTMLWAFLPWSLLAYYAAGSRIREIWKSKFRYIKNEEGLTIATIVLIFILISLSRFQLPHYLNILFPFFSILVAAKLMELSALHNEKPLRIIKRIQVFIAVSLAILACVLSTWAFPVTNIFIGLLALIILFVLCWAILNRDAVGARIVQVSVAGGVFVNILLNGSFYPEILHYQGGSNLAENAKSLALNQSHTYYYHAHNFAFDFYTAYLHQTLSLSEIKRRAGENSLQIFTDKQGLDTLRLNNIPFAITAQHSQYHLTRLKFAFINPSTRPKTLDSLYILKINKQNILP